MKLKYIDENKKDKVLEIPDKSRHNLRVDCQNCFGFCCVALYFSASEGFPVDKAAGKPCPNLKSDFSCSVHKDLRSLGLKGCTSYDCFGAGQKVAKVTYGGDDWQKVPESAKQMYEVFLIMRQIHEMLWYLTEALTLQHASRIYSDIITMLKATEHLTLLSPDALIELDLAAHRAGVNALILQASELVRANVRRGRTTISSGQKVLGRGLDLIGADLRKTDLRGGNLRGAYLIAANLRGVDLSGADLIGADLRDADIRGANLTHSIFITQAQINTAKGDSETKLPKSLLRSIHWQK
jgi:uncharacterized protein YjbI with pentapeptide repeats